MTKKKTIEEIKVWIDEKYNYELVSNEYLGNKEPIVVKCNSCGEFESTFNYLMRGRKLCECYKKRVSKYTIEQIKKMFNDEGYVLLSNRYVDNKKPLDFKCNMGHYETMTMQQFVKGQRCGACFGNRPPSIDYIRQFFEKNGCEFIGDTYINNRSNIEYICSCGNKATTTWNLFQSGHRCNECRYERVRKTMYQNGSTPCSRGQSLIHSIVGGELNYPISYYNVDIALLDKKIIVEFDGNGHDMLVTKGKITRGGFVKKEETRHRNIVKEGWKEIRILCYENRAPSKEVLEKIINGAILYLETSDRLKVVIDLDNNYILYGDNKESLILENKKHITNRMLG